MTSHTVKNLRFDISNSQSFVNVLYRQSGGKLIGADLGNITFDISDVDIETDGDDGILIFSQVEFETNCDLTKEEAKRNARGGLLLAIKETGADVLR